MSIAKPGRLRSRWDGRPPHANPIIEHVFRRFEDGATLREIAVDILDDRFEDVPAEPPKANPLGPGKLPGTPAYRRSMIDHGYCMDFITKLVLATAAPGTEYQDIMQPMADDLEDPQNKSFTQRFRPVPMRVDHTLPGKELP
jgi:hypothetical protein